MPQTGAKAAHGVLLGQLEWGSLQFENTDQIDWIRKTNALEHASGTTNLAKPSDLGRKPWYCKNFQERP